MIKQFPIITLDGYLYSVDKGINGKKGWNINIPLGKPEKLSYDYEPHTSEWNFCVKLVATNNPSPSLSTLPQLPDVVEELALIALAEKDLQVTKETSPIYEDEIYCWRRGYKAAGGMFSEEDIRRALKLRVERPYASEDALIKCLNKQLIPVAIEVEMEPENVQMGDDGHEYYETIGYKPKTDKNIIIGRYIYE